MSGDLMDRERSMIRDPSRWPQWPLLPLVKRTGGGLSDDDGCAVMFADGELDRPVIYIALLIEVALAMKRKRGEASGQVRWCDVFADFERREFSSLDELVAAYRVD